MKASAVLQLLIEASSFMIISIHPHLIKLTQDRKLEKEFRDFLWMKYSYSNSCVFNYTKYGTAKKFGISRSKIQRLVRIFLEQGWCSLRQEKLGVNLLFEDLHSIHLNYADVEISDTKRVKLVLKSVTPKEIFLKFNKVLVEIKNRQFRYVKKIADDLCNPRDLKDLKRAKKLAKRFKYEPKRSESSVLFMSYKSLGKFISRHSSTAGRRLRELVKEKEIRCTRHSKFVCRGNLRVLLEMRATNYKLFLSQGCIFERLSNSYQPVWKKPDEER